MVPSSERLSVATTKSTPAWRWNAICASTTSASSRARSVIELHLAAPARNHAGDRCQGLQVSTVTLDVFPAVEPAFRQLGVHAMRLRAAVVVLAPLTLVPDPESRLRSRARSLPGRARALQLESPTHASLLGKRQDAVTPAGADDDERPDLDERRSARRREPAGGRDPVIDEGVDACRLGEIEPSRAQSETSWTTSPRSNVTSSSETTSHSESPETRRSSLRSGASHPDRIPR